MDKKRSVGVTIIGILAILYSLTKIHYFINTRYEDFFELTLGIYILIAGIGILNMSNWARITTIMLLFYESYLFAKNVILKFDGMVKNLYSQVPPTIPISVVRISIISFIVFFIIIFLSIIFYLTRPKVKEQFSKGVKMEKKMLVGVTVFVIFGVISGLSILIENIYGLVMLMALSKFPLPLMLSSMFGISIIIAAAHISKLKNWARILFMFQMSLCGITQLLFSLCTISMFSFLFVSKTFNQFWMSFRPPLFPFVFMPFVVVPNSYHKYSIFIFLAILFFYFTRLKVKEQFK